MVRHIFQACPVWVYTQSNITQASYSPEYIAPTQPISWYSLFTKKRATTFKRKAYKFVVLRPEMLDLQMVQKSTTAFVLMRSRQTLCIYLAPFKNCAEKVTFSNNFARTYSVNVVLMIMKVKIVGAFLRGIILNFVFCFFSSRTCSSQTNLPTRAGGYRKVCVNYFLVRLLELIPVQLN